ncbi:hypothetical protein BZA77DRAFT_159170 [Pyronema omphalodes]|nr:hypothetical protein BZA77DRAFT_159170 [Pyronema omphalodes]
MSEKPAVSHGRGGQGNICPDSTTYVDGEIHHEADPTASGAAYSSGRGGAGNISSNGGAAAATTTTGAAATDGKGNTRGDGDVIPTEAIVPAREEGEGVHTGRGGEGNAIKTTDGGEKDKIKKRPISERMKKRISAMLAKFK